MNVTIKIEIYPNNDLKKFLANLFGCNRKLYNTVLDYRTSEYQNNNHFVTGKEQTLFINQLKIELPYLKDVHSKILQQVIRDLDTAFNNFWRGIKKGQQIGYPKFKSKSDEQTCRFPSDIFNRPLYVCNKVTGNRISLIKLLQKIHFKCSNRDEIFLNKNQKYIRSVTCTKSKTNRYFLSILFNIPDSLVLKKKYTNKVIGLDLGIKDFIVDSNSNKYDNLKLNRKYSKKLKRLQRQLSKKQKGSNNRNKARIRLAKCYEKITNTRNTYMHQLSSKIVNENQIICIEDLNVKGMMLNHKLAAAVLEVSLGEFRRLLEYKSRWYGRKLVVINRYYPSSKTCSNCGYVKKDLTLKDRSWVCPECGVTHDRDYNAAINILNEGLKYL